MKVQSLILNHFSAAAWVILCNSYLPRPKPGAPCGLNPGGGAKPAGGVPPNAGGGNVPGKDGGPG